uniref:Uncharacterized protein n=1 Tax=Ananas comosus var. bracteatus TaxID=296719 RepID=A0A6V7QHI1_ANACO|nr:unnamed protein product [Ananas comosus var. bracteatus]
MSRPGTDTNLGRPEHVKQTPNGQSFPCPPKAHHLPSSRALSFLPLRPSSGLLQPVMQNSGAHRPRESDRPRARNSLQDAPIPDPPAIVPPPSVIIPPVVSGPSDSDSAATRTEHEQSLAVLTAFLRFNPPMFDGKKADPWVLETWLASMEALFEDIDTLKKDKIHLAAHYFEKDTQN